MFEIRFYRYLHGAYDKKKHLANSSNKKIRTMVVKSKSQQFGFIAWIRLWFTLRKKFKQLDLEHNPRI